jgi:preprotein translocase subunit SecY
VHISAFGAALRTPDLRKKIFFTLGLLALYRLGSVVPTPGVDYTAIQRCINVVQDNSVYALINLFSGGALLQLSVFALGIMPYITASIILQLLTVVIPRLETLKADGQAGQAKITQYTRSVSQRPSCRWRVPQAPSSAAVTSRSSPTSRCGSSS